MRSAASSVACGMNVKVWVLLHSVFDLAGLTTLPVPDPSRAQPPAGKGAAARLAQVRRLPRGLFHRAANPRWDVMRKRITFVVDVGRGAIAVRPWQKRANSVNQRNLRNYDLNSMLNFNFENDEL